LLIIDAKRLIGRKFDDAEVQSDMKHWPFEVRNEGTRPKVEVEYKGEKKRFFPEEVSTQLQMDYIMIACKQNPSP
jgi:L1 cell adhesion molecule like protein